MEADLIGKLTFDFLNLQDTCQELAQFHRLLTYRGCTRIVMITQVFIVIANHRNATARRRDNVVVAVKDIDEFFASGLACSI